MEEYMFIQIIFWDNFNVLISFTFNAYTFSFFFFSPAHILLEQWIREFLHHQI